VCRSPPVPALMSDSLRRPEPSALSPQPLYACLFEPLANVALVALAQDFSPRFERHRGELISIDISGLRRLFGDPRALGEALRRSATSRGMRVQVGIAATRTAAMILAVASPGLTVVDPGGEAAALAPLPIDILEKVSLETSAFKLQTSDFKLETLSTLKSWGIRTLGAFAALPSTDLAARLGQLGIVWQSLARGQDVRPLVPTQPEERFESSVELEWPIDGLEPLSFVLTRLLEPLSTRLERRDRGAAVIHVELGLVKYHDSAISPSSGSPIIYSRSLQLPAPMRDVRALRTLILLDLESHPPPAAVERVSIRIDPTPGRVLQHTLFTRAHPTPEQLSTLVARLNALMGQDRIGRPVLVDTYRPGAFEMQPFATEHKSSRNAFALIDSGLRRPVLYTREGRAPREVKNDSRLPGEAEIHSPGLQPPDPTVVSALRRCRHPVPARVAVVDGRPVSVTTDRRGFEGGRVLTCVGPWRTSGNWWHLNLKSEVSSLMSEGQLQTSNLRLQTSSSSSPWDRDEWDVSLSDRAVYRIFRDRETNGWFIDAIVD
jgi:protein ImuB